MIKSIISYSKEITITCIAWQKFFNTTDLNTENDHVKKAQTQGKSIWDFNAEYWHTKGAQSDRDSKIIFEEAENPYNNIDMVNEYVYDTTMNYLVIREEDNKEADGTNVDII